jgi:hypothetical protein
MPPYLQTSSFTSLQNISRAPPPYWRMGPPAPPNCVSEGLDALGLTLYQQVMQKAGLIGVLRNIDTVTILAPTNDAFYAWAVNTGSYATSALQALMYYHIIKGGSHGPVDR